jgi:DnaD/phage-associated family protein
LKTLPEANIQKARENEPMVSNKAQSFSGFQEDNLSLVRLPESFFTQVLPKIESITQLRLLLYFFWHFEQQQGSLRFLKLVDLTSDPFLMNMVGEEAKLKSDLDELINMGVLLEAAPTGEIEKLYFINGPQGRAAVHAIENGDWKPGTRERKAIQVSEQKPNIFELYEENIGAITPMMAEILKEDEKTYPEPWIKQAIEIAVTRNVRNWKYVQAILERWQKEGRRDEQNRRNDSQDPSRYRKWLEK